MPRADARRHGSAVRSAACTPMRVFERLARMAPPDIPPLLLPAAPRHCRCGFHGFAIRRRFRRFHCFFFFSRHYFRFRHFFDIFAFHFAAALTLTAFHFDAATRAAAAIFFAFAAPLISAADCAFIASCQRCYRDAARRTALRDDVFAIIFHAIIMPFSAAFDLFRGFSCRCRRFSMPPPPYARSAAAAISLRRHRRRHAIFTLAGATDDLFH